MPDADARLRAALQGDPPPAVGALDDDARADLAGLVEQARTKQGRTLLAAFDATLKFVPFPVRKVVKKVLVG